MTHLSRHILSGAAAGFLCFFGALSAEAQEVFLRPALESFVEKDTMLEFRAQIGTFQKVRVRKNEKHPVFGTVVRYENEIGSCADVYIYSLDEEDTAVTAEMFEKHFRETDRDIMKLPETKLDMELPEHKIRSVTRAEAPGRKAPEGCFEAYYHIRNGAMLMDSVLYLALYRNRLVKVRVSYSPEDEGEDAAAYSFIDSIAEMMGKMPRKNSAESTSDIPAESPENTVSRKTSAESRTEA